MTGQAAGIRARRLVATMGQAAVVLLGLAALVFLLEEPHLEGRNARATLFQIYFQDPFLAWVYLGSVPFFVALHRAFGVLGEWRRGVAFSAATVVALRLIRRCATIMLGFVAGGVVFILGFGDPEDRPAGIFMSLLAAMGAGGMAVAAGILARSVARRLRPAGAGKAPPAPAGAETGGAS